MSLLNHVWINTKVALLDGDDANTNFDGSLNNNKVVLLDKVLENIREDLMASATASIGASNSDNVAGMIKVILPVARRVFPGLVAHELIDVEVIDSTDRSLPITKLCARWTFEIAQDAEARRHGLDIEAEIMAALAQEVNAEYDQWLFHDLKAYAPKETQTFKFAHDVEKSITEQPLTNKILSVAKEISANRVIVGPWMLSVLQAEGNNFPLRDRFHFNTKYVGTIENMKVYVDQYSSDTSPIILLRQEPGNSAGVLKIKSPINTGAVVIDPQTFEPVVQFVRRSEFVPAKDITDKVRLINIDSGLTFI